MLAPRYSSGLTYAPTMRAGRYSALAPLGQTQAALPGQGMATPQMPAAPSAASGGGLAAMAQPWMRTDTGGTDGAGVEGSSSADLGERPGRANSWGELAGIFSDVAFGLSPLGMANLGARALASDYLGYDRLAGWGTIAPDLYARSGIPEMLGTTPAATGEDAGMGAPEGGYGAGGPQGATETYGGVEGPTGANEWRFGGFTGDDGDGILEPIRGTVHEGEVVMSPEAVRKYGRSRLEAMNARALRGK